MARLRETKVVLRKKMGDGAGLRKLKAKIKENQALA